MNQNWSLPFRYLIGLLLLAALLAFLVYAHEALEPVIIAAFIAYLANPAIVILSKKNRLKRRTAVNLVYFGAIALFVALPATLAPLFADELSSIGQDFFSLLRQTQNQLAQPVLLPYGFSLDLSQLGSGLGWLQNLFDGHLPTNTFLLLESTSRGAVWVLVIVVLVYLFLSEWQDMREWLLELPPEPFRPEVAELYQRIRTVWLAYLRGQILLMFIVAIVFSLAWTILGIPGALVLGVTAGLLTLVPDVGPLIGAGLAMAVSLLEGSSWIPLSNLWITLIVLVVYLVLINIKNLWVRPLIMGRMVNMHEGVIFVAILTATVLSGIMGALLVVPLLASATIIIHYLLRRVTGKTPFQLKNIPPHPTRPAKRPRKINRN